MLLPSATIRAYAQLIEIEEASHVGIWWQKGSHEYAEPQQGQLQSAGEEEPESRRRY